MKHGYPTGRLDEEHFPSWQGLESTVHDTVGPCYDIILPEITHTQFLKRRPPAGRLQGEKTNKFLEIDSLAGRLDCIIPQHMSA